MEEVMQYRITNFSKRKDFWVLTWRLEKFMKSQGISVYDRHIVV